MIPTSYCVGICYSHNLRISPLHLGEKEQDTAFTSLWQKRRSRRGVTSTDTAFPEIPEVLWQLSDGFAHGYAFQHLKGSWCTRTRDVTRQQDDCHKTSINTWAPNGPSPSKRRKSEDDSQTATIAV